MSPLSASRPRIRALSLTAISVLLISISLAWARRQQAGSPSFKSARNHSSPVLIADKGAIAPDATTITVNSLSDVANGSDGLCTLREAVTAANTGAASGATPGECNAGSGSYTINFSVTGTITLSNGPLLNTSTNVSIAGPGANQLVISGNNTARLLQITPSGVVSLSDITLTNFNGTCCMEIDGGAINNKGTLTLTRVSLFGNTTTGNGGALYNSGTMTLESCVIGGLGAGQANTNTISGKRGRPLPCLWSCDHQQHHL